MSRLILPLLTIFASLHRLHGLLTFSARPHGGLGAFGAPKSRSGSVGALGATRKELDGKSELGEDDPAYTPAPWEDELHAIINRKRLEKAWVNRAIKSKTRFFSYKRASEWAKMQNMWLNRAEWYEWIAMGEGKPSLVPSDPERYYSNQGTWISWDDFLGVVTRIEPQIDPDSMDGAGI